MVSEIMTVCNITKEKRKKKNEAGINDKKKKRAVPYSLYT